MKVLIVDNDPLSLELSKMFLEVFYDIISDTVESAGEAIKKLEEYSYDVVVADYDMPFVDGITFLRIIRNKRIDIPFILFTGIEEKEIMIRALENGAHYYVQKNGDPKIQYLELSKLICQAVKGRPTF